MYKVHLRNANFPRARRWSRVKWREIKLPPVVSITAGSPTLWSRRPSSCAIPARLKQWRLGEGCMELQRAQSQQETMETGVRFWANSLGVGLDFGQPRVPPPLLFWRTGDSWSVLYSPHASFSSQNTCLEAFSLELQENIPQTTGPWLKLVLTRKCDLITSSGSNYSSC